MNQTSHNNKTETMSHHYHHCCTFFFIFFSLFIFFPSLSISLKTLTSHQPLTTNQTLISAGDVFELGFFTLPGELWYVGIWYRNIPQRTIVWVANRDNPLTTNPSAAALTISNNCIVLLDQEQALVWSSNQTKVDGQLDDKTLLVELLDNGNLVLREENNDDPEEFLWQSFDFPTDTLLPEMKLGWDLDSGFHGLTSWKHTDDPSSGDYTYKLNFHGFPEFFISNEQKRTYRSGPWNGLRFSGVPEMNPQSQIAFKFVSTDNKIFYSYTLVNKSLHSRLVVNPYGNLERYTWIENIQAWRLFWFAPKDQCDKYRECGPFGICNPNSSPVCKCFRGFRPRNPETWKLRDGSGGCVRETELECLSDKFLHVKNMKLPESGKAVVKREMGIKECEKECLKNCSCVAFSSSDISNGGASGCVMWSGELLDTREYADRGQDLFVRLAASDIGDDGYARDLIIGIVVGVGILLVGVVTWFLWKRKKVLNKRKLAKTKTKVFKVGTLERSEDCLINEMVIANKKEYSTSESNEDELELPLIDFNTLQMATDNFSDVNKLGRGGFGCVYKGKLIEGQEIAVKRLSKKSGQGSEEFKNEVRLIARLQHRNLVRLLGCCIETDERMLIYEYMENRSLDSILFNKARSSLLNWQQRYNIICGIARGLLYLHQDSRFRIIHRDMKASNILLDRDMNPKISDFGMARIFGGDQTEGRTQRIVGTYGYMSPEYTINGIFSTKSDIYSFGVLVLEIVSGKRNWGFYQPDKELNLLGQIWELWREGKGLEIIDSSMGEDSYSINEVLRCIQVGLLCVQERAEDRPTMASVVLMLSSENPTMANPKTPGFILGRSPAETNSSSSNNCDKMCSVNQVTVTELNAR